jgi:chaperonin GroEL
MDEAGDGTTSTIIFLTEILEQLYQETRYAGTISTTKLKSGIDDAIEQIVQYFEHNKEQIETEEDLKNISLISTNGDEKLSNLIVEAFSAVGRDGSIVIEESKSANITTLEVKEGYTFESGYVAQAFSNVEGQAIARHNGAFVLVCDEVISDIIKVAHVISLLIKQNKPLVIIADDITGAALAALILTNEKAKKGIADNLRVFVC